MGRTSKPLSRRMPNKLCRSAILKEMEHNPPIPASYCDMDKGYKIHP